MLYSKDYYSATTLIFSLEIRLDLDRDEKLTQTNPGDAESDKEGLLRGEILKPVWPARAPAARHIGIVELRVKAARLLVGHDQFPVFRRCYFVQLSIRYRPIVVVLLLLADQPVPVRHLRWNYRERLHVSVRQHLRVLARHRVSIITDPLPCVFLFSLSLLAALFAL